MKRLGFLFLLITASAVAQQHTVVHSNPGIDFIPNHGQWGNQVRYKVGLRNCNVFLENNSITYNLSHPANGGAVHDYLLYRQGNPPILKSHAYRVTFAGASTNPISEGQKVKSHYVNYIHGKDPSKWKGNIHPFEAVNYKELYQGVGLYTRSQDGHFVYDFIVSPNADPSQIKLQFDGADYLKTENGNLVIGTSVGEIIESEPYVYQDIDGKRIQVACRYKLKDNLLTYVFPNGYDKNHELIIDPTVVFATFSGSTADNWGCTATYDNSGNFYAGGVAFDIGYPTTTGAYQTTYAGGYCDVSVTKFNPSGTSLIYSTYIGGSGEDRPHSMMIDASGNLAITGHTASFNYPTTSGAYQTFLGGSYDMFVTKLNSTGTGLVGSTYIGGSNDDGINNWTSPLHFTYGDDLRGEVIVDNSGNVYVAGNTFSNDFPVTSNATQSNLSGTQDGVALKFNSSLTTLSWSTYLGGSNYDAAYNIILDNAQANVFVSGGTNSSNFPVTSGTYQTSFGGTIDGFIAKYENSGSYTLQKATYIGESDDDQCFGLQIDWGDNIYTTGHSVGGAFPVSSNVYSNPNSAQFLMKLNSSLTNSIFSTVFGSGDPYQVNITTTAFLVDTCGSIYIAGWGGTLSGQSNTSTYGMAVTSDAFKSITDGKDFYFIVFSYNAENLLFATFMGTDNPLNSGEHVDGGTSRFNKAGEIYEAICGGCNATDFPTTPGVWSETNQSWNCNEVSLKIAFQLLGAYAEAGVANDTIGCVPFTVQFENNSSNADSYLWDFGDGSATTNQEDPLHTFITPGTYTVMLVATNDSVCISSDTAYLQIIVTSSTVELPPDTTLCEGISYLIDPGTASTYLWQDGSTNSTFTVTTAGTYSVTVTFAAGCSATDDMVIDYYPLPVVELGDDTVICNYIPITLDAGSDGTSYLWSTGETTQTIVVSSTAIYYVTVSNLLCESYDLIGVTFMPFVPVELGPDTILCDGTAATLASSIYNPPFLWSTGDTTSFISVITPGTYWLHVGTGSCASSDTVSLAWKPSPVVDLGPDTLICKDDTVRLFAGDSAYKYIWSTGETATSIVVTNPPQIVSVIAWLGSCTTSDVMFVALDPCLCIYVPNAFSPNADGINDKFDIIYCPLDNYLMNIYNRWGEKVYTTNDPEKSWNGIYKGTPQPVGVYAYYIEAVAEGEKIFRKGNVTLMR